MGVATGTISPELWAGKTLQAMRKALLSKQYVVNSITDYTPFVKNKQAAAYHGPKISGIEVQEVATGTDFSSPSATTKSSVDIAFTRKFGAPFYVDDIANAQTNLALQNVYTTDSKDAIIDGYDLHLMKKMINGVSTSAPDHLLPYADTSNDYITEADFRVARKLLNAAGAPLKGRYCIVNSVDEAQLSSIANFISADKIGSAKMKEGVIGRVLGFDILFKPDLPLVDDDGTINATAGENLNYCALFYHSLAVGFARQLEFKVKTQPDALATKDLINIYSVGGSVIQYDDYIVEVYNPTATSA